MLNSKRAAKVAHYYQKDFDFAVSVENWVVKRNGFNSIFQKYSDLHFDRFELWHFYCAVKDKNCKFTCVFDTCKNNKFCSRSCSDKAAFILAGKSIYDSDWKENYLNSDKLSQCLNY